MKRKADCLSRRLGDPAAPPRWLTCEKEMAVLTVGLMGTQWAPPSVPSMEPGLW